MCIKYQYDKVIRVFPNGTTREDIAKALYMKDIPDDLWRRFTLRYRPFSVAPECTCTPREGLE